MASRVLVALRVRATPERAFEAFTREINAWWQPNPLFQFTSADTRELAFEPGPGGRLTVAKGDGQRFEIGRIEIWQPPSLLVFSWRQESFAADQRTTVRVSFEPVDQETRVTVEHSGWDGIPREHAARHGLPLDVFQLRHAEWWQRLIARLAIAAGGSR
jgi:uncharacterized protein YndB with AHSA1/START domain